MAASFYAEIELPPGLGRAARDAFSSLVLRLSAPLSFQGLEDWSVDVPRSRILGAEREFHDLSRVGTLSGEMRVYFAQRADAARFAKVLRLAFSDLRVRAPLQLAPRDWMRAWRKHYRTQLLREGAQRLAIVPAWKKVPRAKNTLAVRIYPGQAFGTGTHPTTQLCLKLFLRYLSRLPQGKGKFRVLDFGAGTGVLALASEKWALSAKRAFRGVAVESDPVALAQCQKNLRLNRSTALVCKLRAPQRGRYDLVFANVLAPVLLAQREALLAALAPQGILLLSGLLRSEAKSFLRKFRDPRVKLLVMENQLEWSAIALQRL